MNTKTPYRRTTRCMRKWTAKNFMGHIIGDEREKEICTSAQTANRSIRSKHPDPYGGLLVDKRPLIRHGEQLTLLDIHVCINMVYTGNTNKVGLFSHFPNRFRKDANLKVFLMFYLWLIQILEKKSALFLKSRLEKLLKLHLLIMVELLPWSMNL